MIDTDTTSRTGCRHTAARSRMDSPRGHDERARRGTRDSARRARGSLGTRLRTVLATAVIVSAFGCGGGGTVPSEMEGQNPSGGVNAAQWLDTDPVILISFDGFRWDYVDRYQPPAFLEVARRGVRTTGSMPPFPSKTFPSHYSLATGLWADHHELVGNRFWDPAREAEYDMSDRVAVEDGSWYAGEPIWVTAELQGMVAASFFFVGSEADVGGVRPSHWMRFDGSIPGEDRVDQVLDWLRMPPETRPRMITLYFSDVDGAGHRFGPDSEEVQEAIVRVDGWLQRLIDGLDAMEGGDRVTVLLGSDHGMYANEDVVELDVRDLDGVRFEEGGPYASLFVDGDAARQAEVRDAIAAQMPPEVDVFLRADVPDSLHYSATPKVGDVIVVPPLGMNVIRAGSSAPTGFTHGWNPWYTEMHGILIGMGPRIVPGSTLGRIRHVDVYPLMAELLGLDPAPVDGDVDVWSEVLTGG